MEFTTYEEFVYLGCCLEGFLFGLYSGIFAMYLRHYGSPDKAKNLLFYAVCVSYALSAATIVPGILYLWTGANVRILFNVAQIIENIAFVCCDFITQIILIHRCWIVWDCNISIVILPSFLAFASLVIWIVAAATPWFIVQGRAVLLNWANILVVTGFALSMTVNALVTGLIVFRIFKVFQAVKTSQISGATASGGNTFRRVIFILIESGMALFSIQLARVVVWIVDTNSARNAQELIAGIHEMLNGITPTLILVRVSMGLSPHNENSMVETSRGSLRFAPNDSNPVPETGPLDIVDQGRDNNIEIQSSDGYSDGREMNCRAEPRQHTYRSNA